MTILPDYTFTRVLAIDPCQSGFGFAVLEGRRRLVDWGVARVWAESDKEFLARVESYVLRYHSRVLVLHDLESRKRSQRAVRRIGLLASYGESIGLRTVHVPSTTVRATFEAAGTTKHQIAVSIAGLYPELQPHLPRQRKPWMSEDERMNLFDAVALAITALSSPESVGH